MLSLLLEDEIALRVSNGTLSPVRETWRRVRDSQGKYLQIRGFHSESKGWIYV